jgi:hypothetical protein
MRRSGLLLLVVIAFALSISSQALAIHEYPDPQEVPLDADPDVDPDGLEGIVAGPTSPTPTASGIPTLQSQFLLRLFASAARIGGF